MTHVISTLERGLGNHLARLATASAAAPGAARHPKTSLVNYEIRPWRSATFDGHLHDFTVTFEAPAEAAAAASARLAEALCALDLAPQGEVLIDLAHKSTRVERRRNGWAACYLEFSALTVSDE